LHRDIGETLHFEVAQDKLAKFKASFANFLEALQTCVVPRRQFENLLRLVLLLRRPENLHPDNRKAEDWDALDSHLHTLCDRYAEKLGENAYAVFNVVTDFASHPPANRIVARERHSLQRLAGSWVSDFSTTCQRQGFDLDEYLESLEKGEGPRS
jgi:hypothetical protein